MRARLVTTVSAVATATLLPAFMMIGAQSAYADSGNGNKGTVKISEVGGAADESNDPHVGCTFDVQWWGYTRSKSAITFEGQAPTKDVDITITGPKTVELPAVDSADKINLTRTYTLAFKGDAPQAKQGYHVKMLTETETAKGNDKKSKVFWVACGVDVTPVDPTDPTTPTDPTDPTTPTDPTDPTVPPFSWDWTYEDPTCAGVSVDYPSNIPDGQANDVNIRVETPSGTKTLNFHKNDGFWSGRTDFNLADHAQWDAGTESYAITWVQVGGTNYHWQGKVACATDGDPATADAPLNDTEVTGFRTGSITVGRGSTVSSDTVEVAGAGDADLELQVWTTTGSARGAAAGSVGHWATAKTVETTADGTARVTFPKLTKKGTYKFRLAVAGSASTTGDTTGTLKVRVR